MKSIVIVFNSITILGIIIHWTLSFLNIIQINDIIPGHKVWSYSFIIPDLWLTLFSSLTIILLLTKNGFSVLSGIILGSTLILNGIFVISYGLSSGLIFKIEGTELIIMSLFTIIVGLINLFYFRKLNY